MLCEGSSADFDDHLIFPPIEAQKQVIFCWFISNPRRFRKNRMNGLIRPFRADWMPVKSAWIFGYTEGMV